MKLIPENNRSSYVRFMWLFLTLILLMKLGKVSNPELPTILTPLLILAIVFLIWDMLFREKLEIDEEWLKRTKRFYHLGHLDAALVSTISIAGIIYFGAYTLIWTSTLMIILAWLSNPDFLPKNMEIPDE